MLPYVSYFVEVMLYITPINTGSPGVTNPDIMEFGGFGVSNNETEILLNHNWSN